MNPRRAMFFKSRFAVLRRFVRYVSKLSAFALATVFLCALAPLSAQQQFQGTCARVKIEISQSLTTERIGFEATLEITNNEAQEAITDFSADLEFYVAELDENGDQIDASDKFFVRSPELDNINRVDGTGVISPTQTATIRWFLIPKPDAGGTKPSGVQYEIGCNLSGNLAGVPIPPEQIIVIPETITVRPEPRLDITYFQPRDVQGDDPFTEEVESPIPFTLGVLVKNTGYAPAKDVVIESEQPRIVENKQGLLLIAQLLGARVQDSPLDQTSLTVNLGDIPPGEARKGAWDMVTSLSGEFVEFKASYTHASELGGEETSLIESLEAHFIAHEVLNDEPGRDDILDFLADTDRDEDRLPDALYESNGNVLPVNHLENAAIGNDLQGREFSVDLSADVEGWGYMRLDDPGQAKYGIEEVVRSDGKRLDLNNVWTNIRYDRDTNEKLTYLNIFDRVDIGSYTYDITYAPIPSDSEPPVTQLRFAGEATEAGETYYITRDTEMYFTSEDINAVSIFYKVDNGPFQPGLPFSFDQPGEYEVIYYAEDSAGNTETESFARLIIPDGGPVFDAVAVAEDKLSLKGDVLSARSGTTVLDYTVGASATQVDADISVFQGVRAFPVVKGVPASPSPLQSVTLEVAGDFTDFYKYRLNDGAWSAEQPVSQALQLSGLAGSVKLEVLGRPEQGIYSPAAQALEFSWTVDAAATEIDLTGLGGQPVRATDLTLAADGPDFSEYRWRPDDSFFRAPLAAGASFDVEALTPGAHTLDFNTDAGDGEAQSSVEQSLAFTVDPAYGADFSGLPEIYAANVADVGGSTRSFIWDGRDNSGVLQTPGFYTVRIELSNPLGQTQFITRLVEIDDLSGGEERMASASEAAKSLVARGDFAVWQARPSGDWDIMARDFSDPAGAPYALTDDSVAQQRPHTDGRWVVWQVRRANGNQDIELFDLENPGAGPTAVTSSSDLTETAPVVDYPWVVYQRRALSDANAPQQLIAHNVATGQTSPVWSSAADQLQASIHGGRVVWQDFRDVGNGEIYFADLESDDRRRLTESVAGQFFPVIRGEQVVWQDNRDGQVDLYGYHLLADRETNLTDTPFDEAHPYLVDRFVIYEENSLGSGTANQRILDLDTGLSVTLTRDHSLNQFGGEAGGHLVWQRREDPAAGVFDLLESPLPALQLISGNYNAVPVTQPIVDAYGDAYTLLAEWQSAAGVREVTRFTQLSPDPVSESALWDAGTASASGTNFPLSAGDFIWVRFDNAVALELGERNGSGIDLAAGSSVLSHTGFPSEYSAYEMAESLGTAKVGAIRMLDARAGFWRVVQLDESGEFIGPNFRIPSSAVLILDMNESVSGWNPRQP